MMRFFPKFLVLAALIGGCSGQKVNQELMEGVWRGVLDVQGHDLAFNFAVKKDSVNNYNVFIKNASENLLLDEISFANDSVNMTLHIFDAVLRAKVSGDSLKGYFIKNFAKNYKIPFRAAYNQDYRFAADDNRFPDQRFEGKYKVTFVNESDTTPAIGIFAHKAGNVIEGTFLTPTGDYRFLEGNVVDDKLYLSTFDGNYAYLFTAEKTSDTTLRGDYWSGLSWHQTWTASRNDNVTLPDAESMTYLKDGYDKIDFKFPDVNGNIISPSDEKYKNKVLILQLFGTWCPNCMDETKFLAPWYKENRDRGVEIIGLAYESKPEFEYASERVKKMIAKMDVDYDFVIGGTRDKAEASKTLPMLNRVVAFPTTIYIGKDGKVKKIHTGFSGPGTGIYYQRFIERFNETVNELLNENLAFDE
ncbi:MAG TPA: TlpA disulfide reductase family protein [Cyclobacteriaceae bacterium]|nr:TlpA disulfide reductase family protein [Cyclobacteriaceae bacterium]